jgi:hypothetical protein
MARARQGWPARAFSRGADMEERIELKDPEHPDAKEAAEATARLLIDVHRKKQERSQTDVDLSPKPNNEKWIAQAGDSERIHRTM